METVMLTVAFNHHVHGGNEVTHRIRGMSLNGKLDVALTAGVSLLARTVFPSIPLWLVLLPAGCVLLFLYVQPLHALSFMTFYITLREVSMYRIS